MKLPILIILLFTSLFFFGQERTEKLSIHYASNVDILSKEQEAEIINFLDKPEIENISLYGFADTVGNVQANQKISERRVNNVKDLILEWYDNLLVVTKANGELAESDNSLSDQRRVDIVITYYIQESPKEENVNDPRLDTLPSATSQPDLTHRDVFYETFGSSDRIVIENLLFEPGKTEFLHNKTPNELFYLVDLMDSLQTMTIHIEGHVCCVDDMKLSRDRAKTVFLFLRANGIEKYRMTYEGYSNSYPRVEELTKEDQKLNRRVEIVVTAR